MAAYTSSQSGNFNDAATWGGGGYPSIAGDTFTVAAGHTVTYNVSSTVELGASTINGILQFSTSMSTKLCFGNVTLTISATGELRIGTSGTPIPAAYTAELLWNTTSDNAQGLSVTNGGKYSIYGDSAFYTTGETTLANDAENTDGDVYIKTVDDMSSVWAAGMELTIKVEKMGDSTTYQDAIKRATIVSISGTTIELDAAITAETGVGSTWFSPVVCVSRNVKVGKIGASTAIANYNTNRPRWVDNTTSNPNTNVITNAMMTGIHSIQVSNASFSGLVVRNGNLSLNSSSYNNTINANIYSCSSGLSCTFNTISGNIYSCTNGVSSSYNNGISGNIYSCDTGITTSANNTVSGNIYSCNYGFYAVADNRISGNIYSCNYSFRSTCMGNIITGKLGYDSIDTSLPNNYDMRGDSTNYLMNCKVQASGLGIYERNVRGYTCRIQCEHYNRTLNAHRVYHNKGDIIKTPCDGTGTSPSVDPDGGNADCIEISNLQSFLSALDPIEAFNFSQYRVWAQASTSKTYTFKIQSIFTATLANTEISLVASYLDGTDGHIATVASTGTIAARSSASDWSQELSVTVNPAQTGWVTFQVKLMKYESGKKIYVWPKVGIT